MLHSRRLFSPFTCFNQSRPHADICTYWTVDPENSFPSSFSVFIVCFNSIASERGSPTMLLKMRPLPQYFFSKNLFITFTAFANKNKVVPWFCIVCSLIFLQVEFNSQNTRATFFSCFTSIFPMPITGFNIFSNYYPLNKKWMFKKKKF